MLFLSSSRQSAFSDFKKIMKIGEDVRIRYEELMMTSVKVGGLVF